MPLPWLQSFTAPHVLSFSANFIKGHEATFPWSSLAFLLPSLSHHKSHVEHPRQHVGCWMWRLFHTSVPFAQTPFLCLLLNTHVSFKTQAPHLLGSLPSGPPLYSFSFRYCTFFHRICYMVLYVFTACVLPIKSPLAGWLGCVLFITVPQFLPWHAVCDRFSGRFR